MQNTAQERRCFVNSSAVELDEDMSADEVDRSSNRSDSVNASSSSGNVRSTASASSAATATAFELAVRPRGLPFGATLGRRRVGWWLRVELLMLFQSRLDLPHVSSS